MSELLRFLLESAGAVLMGFIAGMVWLWIDGVIIGWPWTPKDVVQKRRRALNEKKDWT